MNPYPVIRRNRKWTHIFTNCHPHQASPQCIVSLMSCLSAYIPHCVLFSITSFSIWKAILSDLQRSIEMMGWSYWLDKPNSAPLSCTRFVPNTPSQTPGFV